VSNFGSQPNPPAKCGEDTQTAPCAYQREQLDSCERDQQQQQRRIAMRTRHWSELSDRQQTVLLVAVSVQLSLAATAWADLATRPAALVKGRKDLWAAVIAVNFRGPIAYFARGRRTRVTLNRHTRRSL
jgi:hypothetical protein